MATFKLSDGVQINYQDHGSGQPLVFLHGWAMSSTIFSKQSKDLSDEFRVIAIDLRGQANSGGKDGPLPTIYLLAQDLREIIEGLSLRNVVLVGWSMGALVTWKYYERYGDDRLAGLVVLEMAANLGSPDWALQENITLRENPEKHIRSFVASMFAEPLADAELAWMVAEAMKTPVGVAEHLNLEIACADARPILPKLKVPTLMIYGAVPMFFTKEQIQDTINGTPNARVLVFEKSKHCPFWEEPARCNKEIRKFVKSLSAK